MTDPLFPLVFANDEARLLTAIVIGFLFGFALERGGFGNARKLAAQFYLHDMTVFKVMFTAILVAMVGLYTLVGIGWVDMARVWVNPTFMWAQVAGGLLLGVGFIMSGLCPGTAVVAAASGRWDGAVTLGGMVVGILGFALAVDAIPLIERLYHAGSMGVSLLPAVMDIPTLPFILGVVLLAGTAFVGAEAVERVFRDRYQPVELTPAPFPLAKLAVAGALSLVLLVGLGLRSAPPPAPAFRAIELQPVAGLVLAERLIARDPNLIILDLRPAPDPTIPGAHPAALDGPADPMLAGAGPATDVVLVTETGVPEPIPAHWPALRYRLLEGGWEGWVADVLTPATTATADGAAMDRVRRQNAVSAFFSGAAMQVPVVAAPPPITGGAGRTRPARGGC
jgi:hypothetical protein